MKHFGTGKAPLLLIHGGAGGEFSSDAARNAVQEELRAISARVFSELSRGMAALDAVCEAVEHLEASPIFNAGLGAALSADGLARLSASLMDGARQIFSGVSLATHLHHPIRLVRALQSKKNRVVGPLGAQLIARELGIPPKSPVTRERAQEWAAAIGETIAESYGTVGAVALDDQGRLAAATSTGGIAHSYPERVSDSSTPAGNYSSAFAAISCTGTGEQIMDAGLAIRLESRVRDGLSLDAASERCYLEAEELKHRYGWIALERTGGWAICHTTPRMSAAVIGGEKELQLLL